MLSVWAVGEACRDFNQWSKISGEDSISCSLLGPCSFWRQCWQYLTQPNAAAVLRDDLLNPENSPGELSFNPAFPCSLLASWMFHLAWLVFIQVFWASDLSVQMWAVHLIQISFPKQEQWRGAVLVWKPWKRRLVEQISSLFLPSFLSCNNQLKVAQLSCREDASKPGTQKWILSYWTDRIFPCQVFTSTFKNSRDFYLGTQDPCDFRISQSSQICPFPCGKLKYQLAARSPG